ncbi:anaphase-promoting complex subunit 5 [Fopius arisanus]|uniref:Anaphase-promoting complex subunit 5 n=1 Tax=Fopius arisanus TaxID=64838 RepID=A0A0C9R7U2_9HYME|nr:PREDICTED: anaphase-promoting complex subunit 5 [Fopius arisanus]
MSKDLLSMEETSSGHKANKETLTPYKIGVILLIKEYCIAIQRSPPERRDFCIVALKLIQSPDMDLKALIFALCKTEYVLQRFARTMEVECVHLTNKSVGVEGLLELFDVLSRLVKSPQDHSLNSYALCRSSVLGLYVRRTIIFFEELAFSEVAQLYDAFVEDFEEAAMALANARSLPTPRVDLGNVKEISKNKNIWDCRRAELLVAQQAQALQTDEHKAIPPAKLQVLVRELLACNPYYAEAHYLSYLNCLRVNEYCGAQDSLYHCFDRLAPLENRSATDDRSRTFRYAALNLAALHAQFDHKDVAKAALKEAIMMAQEAGDNVCLQLAHAWMYHLSKENKSQLIERSVGKASMLGITHTTSLGLIASAHNSALEGKSPSHVFQTLIKSDVLNCQHSMTDLMSMSYAEKAALWAYYGKAEMSIVSSQLLLLHNSGNKKQTMFNGASTCQAVVNIVNALVEFGEYSLVDVVLDHAKERFPNEPSNKIWMLSQQLYQLTKLMRHEKWSDAEATANQISSLDTIESKFRLAEVALAKGDYPTGLDHISNIEKDEDLNPQNRVRAMILSSQIMNSSILPGNGITGTNSLVLLNSALEMATKYHLSYYEALVKMHLANVQLIMGMPNQASTLIDEAIVQILAHGGWYDQARALVLHAKCLVATAPQAPDRRRAIIQDAIKALLKARTHFTKVEAFGKVKNTVYLLSLLYNEVDQKAERNQCAFEFRQFDEQYPTKANTSTLY